MRPLIVLIALLNAACIAALAGCSSSPSPTSAEIFSSQAIQNASDIQKSDDRMIWGVWDISIDPENNEVAIGQARELADHYNVTSIITPPKCTNCVVLKVVKVDQTTHVYTIDVTLKNPTNLTGYDVRGTLLFPSGDKRQLVNADGYTMVFANSVKSPFMAFAKEQPQRKFAAKATETEEYKILFPSPANLKVTYVVDASWPGNQEEPYGISNVALDGAVSDDGLISGWLYATVSDWQNNVESVKLDLSSIGGSAIAMQPVGNGEYKASVMNEAKVPAGQYTLWIEAKSANSDNAIYYRYDLTILKYLISIPGGQFEMGDHFGLGGGDGHPNDEIPLHQVKIDAFQIGRTETSNRQVCEYLNSAFSKGQIEVKVDNIVYQAGGTIPYFDTQQSDPAMGISFDGSKFTVLPGRENHPAIGVRWWGAAAYCNWLSEKNGYENCYDLSTWDYDPSRKGYRLPSEAEWEWAARGRQDDVYTPYLWGTLIDNSRANIPNSGDPYETGPDPWTTPVGFYNGQLHKKADYNWPGNQASYQTNDGVNGFGLYDVAGNVWEYCNDWYFKDYYAQAPLDNPQGPVTGSWMPDHLAYHGLRGGNWYNGTDGHARTSNRDPAYYRGPNDPNHSYYHVGFRVALDTVGKTSVKINHMPQHE